ncbi:MAG: hypothetical protein U0L18_00460 [Acutalibacteraceae bacterium]|nr:hypothetical protein [Acutalibacteraceae bacterium]
MSFVKHILDKFKGKVYHNIEISDGTSFNEVIKFEGSRNVSEEIDEKLIKNKEMIYSFSVGNKY